MIPPDSKISGRHEMRGRIISGRVAETKACILHLSQSSICFESPKQPLSILSESHSRRREHSLYGFTVPALSYYCPGARRNLNFTRRCSIGFSGSVSLSVSGLPAGALVSFSLGVYFDFQLAHTERFSPPPPPGLQAVLADGTCNEQLLAASERSCVTPASPRGLEKIDNLAL
jgi:hypothetical protein